MSPRDTHFIRAAELLKEKLEDYGYIRKHREMDELIARFLYDFANHVLRQTAEFTWDAYTQTPIELMQDEHPIPDMTAWPES